MDKEPEQQEQEQQRKQHNISHGIIAFKYDSIKQQNVFVTRVPVRLLMIRRKDSFGYNDFMQGHYSVFNIQKIQQLVDEMSLEEKARLVPPNFKPIPITSLSDMPVLSEEQKRNSIILKKYFHTLWVNMWEGIDEELPTPEQMTLQTYLQASTLNASTSSGLKKKIQPVQPFDFTKQIIPTQEQLKSYNKCHARVYSIHEEKAFHKYELIVNGLFALVKSAPKTRKSDYRLTHKVFVITLKHIVDTSKTCWIEQEWEFPKGHKDFQSENTLNCALREFKEETGLINQKLDVVTKYEPCKESFIGTDGKWYKNNYYLAHDISDLNSIENKSNVFNDFQKNEVSKVEYKTIDECLDCIRPYNTEKLTIINDVCSILTDYYYTDNKENVDNRLQVLHPLTGY